MQVKVFEAPDMNSGLKMVKEALGPDALILSTRTLHNGKLGVLGKATLEITAAIDLEWQEKSVHPSLKSRPAPSRYENKQEDITYQDVWSANDTEGAVYPKHKKQQVVHSEKPNETKLQDEISELRTMINSLSRKMSTPAPAGVSLEAKSESETKNSPGQLLISCGLSPHMAGIVTRFTRDTFHADIGDIDPAAILTDAIARLFTVNTPLTRPLNRQKRICLIGSTGAGKTTTIAKLAAGYLNRFGGKIALITIDTYRIAAVEQLKVYGEIMNIPVEVVTRAEDMDSTLAKHNDCDLILIDTAGRSPGNSLDIEEMKAFLRPECNFEHHLVLSSTSREQEMEMVIESFSCLGIDNFIFSKIDECQQLGVLLNIHYLKDTPISFLTNGQRVPEDIIAPTGEILAELIINTCRQSFPN